MENTTKTKRVWQAPEIEIINSKMTQGAPGVHAWTFEGSYYSDAYAS